MLFFKKRFVLIAVLAAGVFVLSGCSGEEIKQKTRNKLEWLDQKIQEKASESNTDTPDDTSSENQQEEELRASDLTSEQKKKIDDWLKDKGLNRYGDSQGVIYPDGTPLYNKEKDKKIKRFNYILDRYPNILERIKEN